MGKRIRIKAGSVTMLAELNDSATAQAVEAALPLKASAQIWGDEIYFSIPVKQSLEEDAAELVSVGDLGYWPPGKAFCIFFGPTPLSRGAEIRPASAVNLIARSLEMRRGSKAYRIGTPSCWRSNPEMLCYTVRVNRESSRRLEVRSCLFPSVAAGAGARDFSLPGEGWRFLIEVMPEPERG